MTQEITDLYFFSGLLLPETGMQERRLKNIKER